jgi:hypothetical protein
MYSKPENALSFSIHSPLQDEHGGRMEDIRIEWTERTEAPKGTRWGEKNEVGGEDEIL